MIERYGPGWTQAQVIADIEDEAAGGRPPGVPEPAAIAAMVRSQAWAVLSTMSRIGVAGPELEKLRETLLLHDPSSPSAHGHTDECYE